MTMAIIGVLAYTAAWIMIYSVKNGVFLPNQLNMDKLVDDALDTMIDGDGQARGLRFSRNITNAAAYRLDFRNQDNATIYYRFDNTTNKLYRSINGGTEQFLPPYVPAAGVNLSGKSGAVFTYYDANESVTSTPANVRRVKIVLTAKSGTGLSADWEGRSEQASSVAVDRLQ